jgi:hypothetical protein
MSDSDFWLMPIGIRWCREEDCAAFIAIFEDRKTPRTWQGFAD